MNERKLNQLFEAERPIQPPAVSGKFAGDVMRAIRRSSADSVSLADQLEALFPKIAFATILLIGLCVAGDFLSSLLNLPSLSDGVTQLSQQWLFTGNGI